MPNRPINKKIPTLEEIRDDFDKFIKDKYGSHVHFDMSEAETPANEGDDEDTPSPEKKKLDLNFDLKPKEVKQYLDRYVIEQDEAKKALSIAVCDHYNHVRECVEDPKRGDEDYSKQNVIILGPTGVGKTYMIRHIAKLIGVPFVKADATRFSETGYVGANVEDLVRDLVTQADDDVELAQYGIVYLDEADKLATPPNIIGRDVSGRGVQIGLLKLMEETEVDLRAGHDVASQMKAVMEFQQKGTVEKQILNTRHILFIISGAFNGLADIIKKRKNQSSLGFNAEVQGGQEDEDYLVHVTPQDFIEFGFEPEFIGRLPIHVTCQNLTVNSLYHILRHSAGSIIRQYEQAFRAYGIDVMFSDSALHKIAEQAQLHKTGARALMTVCEKTLRDYKFELPSSGTSEFVVTEQVIEHTADELKRIIEDANYNRQIVMREHIRRYEEDFLNDHQTRIRFDDEATDHICHIALEQGRKPKEICEEMLQSYQHGLNLIKQNTGRDEFTFTKAVLADPDVVLERWIRDSYAVKSKEDEKS